MWFLTKSILILPRNNISIMNWTNIKDIPITLIKQKETEIKCQFCKRKSVIIYCFHCLEWHCNCKHICAICHDIQKDFDWTYFFCECGKGVCYTHNIGCRFQCPGCQTYKCRKCLKICDKSESKKNHAKIVILCNNCTIIQGYCDCFNDRKFNYYKKCLICKKIGCMKCFKVFDEQHERFYCYDCLHSPVQNGYNNISSILS